MKENSAKAVKEEIFPLSLSISLQEISIQLQILAVFLYLETVQSMKYSSLFHLFTWLPFFSLCASLSLFLFSLAASHPLHSLSCFATVVFSVQSAQKRISRPTASTSKMLTISRDNQISIKRLYLHWICKAHRRSICSVKTRLIIVIVMVISSLLVVYQSSAGYLKKYHRQYNISDIQ